MIKSVGVVKLIRLIFIDPTGQIDPTGRIDPTGQIDPTGRIDPSAPKRGQEDTAHVPSARIPAPSRPSPGRVPVAAAAAARLVRVYCGPDGTGAIPRQAD